ncbi:MAG: hypothetical protein GX793_06575 [Bacteroidales bacterium]|nr:hypothetical protein [Bacteroidales bacterium]
MKQKLQNFKKSAKLTFLILFILFGVLNISKAQQINIYDIYSITGENDIYVYYDLETASELTEVNYVFLDDNN